MSTRRALAEAAVAMFGERGFAAVTAGDVAAAVGVTERTFFRQFATKEDAVFFDLPDILAPIVALDTAAPADVQALMLANARGWDAADALERTRLILREPALHRRFLELAGEWEAAVAQVLGGKDVVRRARAATLVGACRAALAAWAEDPGTTLEAHLRDAFAAGG